MKNIAGTAREQAEERTCDLTLALFRYGGVHTWYDAKAGLRRRVVLSGRIDDPDLGPGSGPDFSAPHFQEKPVRLEISSPPDPEWLGSVAATLGVDDAFGVVWVRANVEPERFELDGETVEQEPVRTKVELEPEAFEAVRRQAAEAYDHRRIIWAKVTLVGEPLPEPDNRLGFIFLKDLDASKDQEYAVGGFEIFDTCYLDHRRGRVLQVERGRDEGYGTHVSVLLTEARYKVNIERAYVHSISCEGRVINGRGKPYDGANVTVEFSEYELNSFGELPERAFFGEFDYYAKRSEEGSSSNYFWFRLRHVPGDARDLLIPLLAQEAETRVILTVGLTNEEEELLAATDELWGNVRYYSFEVQRRLTNEGSEVPV